MKRKKSQTENKVVDEIDRLEFIKDKTSIDKKDVCSNKEEPDITEVSRELVSDRQSGRQVYRVKYVVARPYKYIDKRENLNRLFKWITDKSFVCCIYFDINRYSEPQLLFEKIEYID